MASRMEKNTTRKRKNHTVCDSFISFVHFNSIVSGFCVIPLPLHVQKRNFLAVRAFNIVILLCTGKNTINGARFVSFFIKITGPISCLSFFSLSLISPTGLSETLLRWKIVLTAHLHSWHCFLRCFTYFLACMRGLCARFGEWMLSLLLLLLLPSHFSSS